jgi:hypothetical protein
VAASAAELDAFRDETDRFVAEFELEHYLHLAGLKATLDLEPIYERHAALAGVEQARRIGAAGDGSRNRELHRFACERHLGELTRSFDEGLAAAESGLEATVDGETIPFRMLGPTLANEPDRDRRRRLDEARCELTDEHLNPLYLERASAVSAGVSTLGAATYLDLYRGFGYALDELAAQCREFLETTARAWENAGDRLLRTRVGVGLGEARRWDLARALRAPEWDASFPSSSMLPALEATLSDLGIDLRAQSNVELDLEPRPQKTPRAYCFPIEVPARIVLMTKPIGGPDDWHALFHEAGHAQHFAHAPGELPVEARRLGDNAVTEGWAFLLDHLVGDPAWLERRLDVGRPRDFAAEEATVLLFFVRRYAAKLLYELELHAASDPLPLRERYVELLGDALKIEPAPESYLADVDDGFYATAYLRGWAFEAQLGEFLREEFGSDWFRRREAGSLLRELWSLGQGPTADELLRDVSGAGVELAAVSDRIAARLRG